MTKERDRPEKRRGAQTIGRIGGSDGAKGKNRVYRTLQEQKAFGF